MPLHLLCGPPLAPALDKRTTPHVTHNTKLELSGASFRYCRDDDFLLGLQRLRQCRCCAELRHGIVVTAKKWVWQFEYPDGTRTLNDLHVPLNKPVKLVMHSED